MRLFGFSSSVHCEKVLNSSQHCLWNLVKFGNKITIKKARSGSQSFDFYSVMTQQTAVI